MPDVKQHPLAICLKLLQTFGEAGQHVWELGKWYAGELEGPPFVKNREPINPAERLAYLRNAIEHLRAKVADKNHPWRTLPVDPRTFVESPRYMNKPHVLWPLVMREFEEINSGRYVEALLTGAIGVAKTTIALYTQAYQVYVLSCMRSPHETFDLDPSSEVLIVFQSINKNLAHDVDYKRMRDMIANAPYFAQHFPFQKDRESDMRFQRNIWVKPVAGHDQAAIGQNVIGGILDELNFMAIVENSKLKNDGGAYNQAKENYNSIARRRESRFMQLGQLPGMLCLVSSRKYPGQFTDEKEAEAKTNKLIYVYDKRLWELRPDRFSGEMMRVFAGDLTRRPRILELDEKLSASDEEKVIEVPVEYRTQFEADILAALRDIAGLSTQAIHPFMMNVDAINACFGKVKSIASSDFCDFVSSRIALYPKRLQNKTLWRFVHLDLAISRDSCGFTVGHVPGFLPVKRGDVTEMLPIIQFDMLLEIRPPKGGEIEFAHVRRLIYALRHIGLPVKWVTSDNEMMSKDTLQILSQQNFVVGYQSMDTDSKAYDVLKQGIYDGRVLCPAHARAQRELVRLEVDPKTQKIDHPASGCFTGETRVALADGTCPTFKQLCQRYAPGETFYVYAMGYNGVEIAAARNPRLTKAVRRTVEVMLDNFQVVRCTSDHLFMTLHGEYVRADQLEPDTRLMPLYRSRELKSGLAGYERVWCPRKRERVLTHHLSVGVPMPGYIVHHKDENKSNNDPRNLEHVTRVEHLRHHGKQLYSARKAAMLKGLLAHYRDPKNMLAAQAHARRSVAKRVASQQNHRVLSVTAIDSHVGVYDLTVPGLENFALAAGVFVHNSKDIADAMAGVAYGLTMRREIWTSHGVALRNVPKALLQAQEQSGKNSVGYMETLHKERDKGRFADDDRNYVNGPVQIRIRV